MSINQWRNKINYDHAREYYSGKNSGASTDILEQQQQKSLQNIVLKCDQVKTISQKWSSIIWLYLSEMFTVSISKDKKSISGFIELKMWQKSGKWLLKGTRWQQLTAATDNWQQLYKPLETFRQVKFRYVNYITANPYLRKRIRGRYISEVRCFVLFTQESKGSLEPLGTQNRTHQGCGGLIETYPHRLRYSVSWFLFCGGVWRDCRIFGRGSLAGGRPSLGVNFECTAWPYFLFTFHVCG